MSERIYEIDLWKECPRCGSKKAKVMVYHFGVTHKPMCKKCGLSAKGGDKGELAEAMMIDAFFKWEENNKETTKP